MKISICSYMGQIKIVTSTSLWPGSGAGNGFSAEHKLSPAAAARRPSGAGHPCKMHADEPLWPTSGGAGSSEQPWQQQRTCTRCCCILQGRLIRQMIDAAAQSKCQSLICQGRGFGYAATYWGVHITLALFNRHCHEKHARKWLLWSLRSMYSN
jgi:hypothetical protein